MRQDIINFPNQFEQGLEFAKNIRANGTFNKIIICGMGGSALPGQILGDYLKKETKIPIYLWRNYNLPYCADRNSLLVCISYSGNTEETISAYKEAIAKKIKVIAISRNGKLEKLAEKYRKPFVKIKGKKIQPRQATGYLFSGLVKVLSNSKVISDKSNEIKKMAKNLNPLEFEKPAINLAKKMSGKIPLIYASHRFKTLARMLKIKFNENSKTMAFWNYFPELNHNEMVGFTKIKNIYYVIILRDKNDQARILKRIKLTAQIIRSKKIKVEVIDIKGKNFLEKVFSTSIFGDWLTYYLAKENKVDPAPVKIVETFKKKMKE